MAFSTNPALNQRLMQLDQEYAQQRANLIQISYTQPQQNNNNWNQNNMQQASQPPQTNQGICGCRERQRHGLIWLRQTAQCF